MTGQIETYRATKDYTFESLLRIRLGEEFQVEKLEEGDSVIIRSKDDIETESTYSIVQTFAEKI